MPDDDAEDDQPPDEIHDPTDLEFQRRDWRRERIGWTVLVLFVIAAVLGLVGEGLFSARTVGADTGFVLTYERAARRHDQTQMTAEVDLAATDGDTAELRISASYLDAIDLRGVVPEPEGVAATDDGAIFRFELDPEATGGTARFRFTFRPDAVGFIDGEIELVGHTTHSIRQFVFP